MSDDGIRTKVVPPGSAHIADGRPIDPRVGAQNLNKLRKAARQARHEAQNMHPAQRANLYAHRADLEAMAARVAAERKAKRRRLNALARKQRNAA